MISAEVPMLFAKAGELFIEELTLRAWAATEDNKRKTMQVFGDNFLNRTFFYSFLI